MFLDKFQMANRKLAFTNNFVINQTINLIIDKKGKYYNKNSLGFGTLVYGNIFVISAGRVAMCIIVCPKSKIKFSHVVG